MRKDKMTIMFCTCDKYNDLWKPFFTIFSNQWKDCKYDILLNTESEEFSFTGLNIHSLSLYRRGENISYGKRMIDHIKSIKTKYTMIVLDDFFLRCPVNDSKIDKVIDYMDNHSDIECVRVTPFNDRKSYEKCIKVDDFPGYYQIPQFAQYKLSFQVCIWNTSALLKYWNEEDDPWRWEVFANITTFDSKGFLVVDEQAGPLLDYGYKVNGQPLSDVYRGKWVKENNLDELFKKNNVEVDFSQRGYYKKEEEIKHFTNIGTMKYVIKRIGVKHSITLFNFVIVNKIRAVFHWKHYQLSEYPIAFKNNY